MDSTLESFDKCVFLNFKYIQNNRCVNFILTKKCDYWFSISYSMFSLFLYGWRSVTFKRFSTHFKGRQQQKTFSTIRFHLFVFLCFQTKNVRECHYWIELSKKIPFFQKRLLLMPENLVLLKGFECLDIFFVKELFTFSL